MTIVLCHDVILSANYFVPRTSKSQPGWLIGLLNPPLGVSVHEVLALDGGAQPRLGGKKTRTTDPYQAVLY